VGQLKGAIYGAGAMGVRVGKYKDAPWLAPSGMVWGRIMNHPGSWWGKA